MILTIRELSYQPKTIKLDCGADMVVNGEHIIKGFAALENFGQIEIEMKFYSNRKRNVIKNVIRGINKSGLKIRFPRKSKRGN